MPLPHNVHPGTRRSLRGLIHRALHREPPAPAAERAAVLEQPVARPGVDAATRRYWANGGEDRIAALLRAHETGTASSSARPRGNPAFSETLFIELMRAKQFRRAFDHLSPECRERWGSADGFAAAQGGGLRRLTGVTVKEVRYLPEWTDERSARRYRDVAELDVEYTLAAGEGAAVVPRVVHLVPHDGKWRSICYPE